MLELVGGDKQHIAGLQHHIVFQLRRFVNVVKVEFVNFAHIGVDMAEHNDTCVLRAQLESSCHHDRLHRSHVFAQVNPARLEYFAADDYIWPLKAAQDQVKFGIVQPLRVLLNDQIVCFVESQSFQVNVSGYIEAGIAIRLDCDGLIVLGSQTITKIDDITDMQGIARTLMELIVCMRNRRDQESGKQEFHTFFHDYPLSLPRAVDKSS